MTTEKPLSICLMNDCFPPVIDGVSNAVINYANVLDSLGQHVTVATPQYPGAKDDYPYPVWRYPSFDTTYLVGYRTGLPFDISYLARFKKQAPDIIHSHCPFSSQLLGRTVRDLVHKPLIMTYHTKYDIEIKKAVDSRLIQKAALSYLTANIAASDEVWVVSKGAGENLRSLGYQGDYVIMENGVDLPRKRAGASRLADFDARWSLRPGIPTYLFVGRLMWYKGLKITLDALAGLQDAGLDFQMLLVGSGRDEKAIREYIRQIRLDKKCIFTGPVYDRRELTVIYSRADLFLFPSTFDTNGIVVREAAACGCASMLIKDSCAAEGTSDNVNALLINENAAAMAVRLAAIGNNHAYYRRLGRQAGTDLYISWQDAVSRANQRYQIVAANYTYHKAKALPAATDELCQFIAGLTRLKAAADSAGASAQNRLKDGKEKIQSYLDRYL